MKNNSNSRKKVLFLCTGNAVRSQMCEGAMNSLHGDVVEAFSAGIEPMGVHAYSKAVMREKGIDISHHTSKAVEEVMHIDFDLVVSVCDHAAKFCPGFPKPVRRVHMPIRDPVFINGTADQVIDGFRTVRDEIFHDVIPAVMKELEEPGK